MIKLKTAQRLIKGGWDGDESLLDTEDTGNIIVHGISSDELLDALPDNPVDKDNNLL